MFNQFLSITAGRFLEFFVPWMILTHTHVPALATAAMAVIPLSSALLILPLGQWVGRGSITHLPRLSQLIQGTSFLFLALLMHTGLSVANLLWAIFGTVIVYAQAASVLNLTLSPQLRVVFGRDQMIHLSNYREGVDAIVTLMAPIAAGIIYSHWHPIGGVFAVGILYAIAAWSLTGIAHVYKRQWVPLEPHTQIKDVGAFHTILHYPLRTLVIVEWVANFITVGVELDLILFMAHTLHLSPIQAGTVFSVAGAGDLLAVFALGRWQKSPRFHPERALIYAFAVLVLGALVLLMAGNCWNIAVGLFVLDGGLAAVFVLESGIRNMIVPVDRMIKVNSGLTFSAYLVRTLASVLPGLAFSLADGRVFLGMTMAGVFITMGLLYAHRGQLQHVVQLNRDSSC